MTTTTAASLSQFARGLSTETAFDVLAVMSFAISSGRAASVFGPLVIWTDGADGSKRRECHPVVDHHHNHEHYSHFGR